MNDIPRTVHAALRMLVLLAAGLFAAVPMVSTGLMFLAVCLAVTAFYLLIFDFDGAFLVANVMAVLTLIAAFATYSP